MWEIDHKQHILYVASKNLIIDLELIYSVCMYSPKIPHIVEDIYLCGVEVILINGYCKCGEYSRFNLITLGCVTAVRSLDDDTFLTAC